MRGNGKIKLLAQMAGLLSAVNGGIIGALKKMDRLDNCLKLQILLPGIDAGSIKAEIKDNFLTVQYFMEMKSEKVKTKIANIVHNEALPYFIDIRKISAHFSDGKLDITMPYNEMAEGYNNELDIK